MHDEPIPQPQPGWAQIQIKSVGVCASDVHWYKDGRIGNTVMSDPIILGHEASGMITALGDGVDSLKIGDRVVIEPAKPCMKCEFCLSGHVNVCLGAPFFGTPPTDGCFCDYIVWPAELAIKIPDCVSFDDAAMVEPLAVGDYAVELSQIASGDTVAIFGAGAIGLSTLQAAKLAGASKIIISDPIAARREMALTLGATEAIEPTEVRNAVNAITSARGVDIAFECSGSEEAVRECCEVARILGKVIIVGIPDGDTYPFAASASRRKQLSAIFVRRSNLNTERCIEYVAEGKMEVKPYASHHFTLEQTKEAMELAITRGDGLIRAIIAVNE